MNFYKKKL